MRWVERADELLFDGETVESRVEVGEGGVVVTSHRVLAFTPDREGPNYRAVDRPNVERVERTTSGHWPFLERGAKAVGAGVALLVASQLISLDGLVGDVSLGGSAASQLGMGGMFGLLQTLLTLLTRLDDIMLTFGVLALAFGAVVLGVYAWTREGVIVVTVAGEDDVELSAPETDDGEDDDVADVLRAALFPERPPGPPGDSPA